MTFLWPSMLWLLVLLPLLLLAYFWALRRKRAANIHYPGLALVKASQVKGSRLRRHIPPAILLVAIAGLLLSIARPAAVVTLPSQRSTLILAMDVSGSMAATDVQPTRLEAAKTAARAFVRRQPRNVRLGVVAYSTAAMMVQPPTFNRPDVLAAIDRLETQRSTSIGDGILVSLEAIFPGADFDLESNSGSLRRGFTYAPPQPESTLVASAPGSDKSAAIILMTDGQATTGPNPVEAARKAAERGVRVFTVGFGSPDGSVASIDGTETRVQICGGKLYLDGGCAAYIDAVVREGILKITLQIRYMFRRYWPPTS